MHLPFIEGIPLLLLVHLMRVAPVNSILVHLMRPPPPIVDTSHSPFLYALSENSPFVVLPGLGTMHCC